MLACPPPYWISGSKVLSYCGTTSARPFSSPQTLLKRGCVFTGVSSTLRAMSKTSIPVAIVGLGAVAESHLAAYQDLPDIDVMAVVDPRVDRVQEVSRRLAVPGFLDCTQMLETVRPRIACVLSTVASHRALTEQLAAAGVHVLCEKPIANRVDDAVAMKEACVRSGVQFMYGSSYRYLPAVMKARELIASGAIGKVRLIEERGVVGEGADKFIPMSAAHYPTGTPGGGSFGLFDHGVHLLDVFPWLVGSPVRRVLGKGNYTGRAVQPEFAMLEHECGALGMLTYDESTVSSDLPWEGLFSHGRSWVNNEGFVGAAGQWSPGASFIRVHGTQGALRIFHYANRLFLSTPGEVREISLSAGAAPEHFGRQLRAFVQALDRSLPAPSGIDLGIDALKILLQIYESAESRRWVDTTEG